MDLFLWPPGEDRFRVTSQGPALFIRLAAWWAQALKDGWVPEWLHLAPPSWAKCKSTAVCPQPVLLAPGSCCPALEEDTPGRKGGKWVREWAGCHRGACHVGHICYEPSSCSEFANTTPDWWLGNLGSAVSSPGCDLQGQGRTGTVTQQAMTWHHFLLLLLARMRSSCPNPIAIKGQRMHASCVQRKEKGQFPVSYIQQQAIPTPHTSSLYLTFPPFFFPIALLLHTLRG